MNQQAPVIDVHCHGAGLGYGDSGCFVSPVMERNWRFRLFLDAFGATRREIIAGGDRVLFRKISNGVQESAQVDAAVVLAFDGAVNDRGETDRALTHLYVPNGFVAQMTREHPALLFGASVNPRRKGALELLDGVTAEGAVLLKWLPPVQHIHPADPRNVGFYEKMVDLGLPLLIHTGTEHAFPGADQSLGNLYNVRLPLEVGVTVIAAHAGISTRQRWSNSARDLAALMQEFPNLYADVSSLTQANRIGSLGPLLAHDTIRSRLVYGTDQPLLETPIVDPAFFCWKLPPGRIREIRAIPNAWDQDVALKSALGVPDSVFTRGDRVLRHPPGGTAIWFGPPGDSEAS